MEISSMSGVVLFFAHDVLHYSHPEFRGKS